MSNKSCRKTGSPPGEGADKGVYSKERAISPVPRAKIGIALACVLGLAGCQAEIIRHGHVFQEEDLQQVQPGMDRAQVLLALGTPDTQSTAGSGAIYYISMTTKRSVAFLPPSITDRRVTAIYFDKSDKVEHVANYGMKDGKIFDFIKRETPTYTRDEGLLKQIFRNIGKQAPAGNSDPNNQ